MAKLKPYQAKSNRDDKKRDKRTKSNRERKRFENKVNAPYSWYVFPDWSFSHRSKVKKVESIMLKFVKPLDVGYISEKLFIAFGDLNERKV